MFFWIESGLTVVALAVGCAVPDLGRRWFESVERLLSRLAQRRGLSVVIVGLGALALRAVLLPILPIPIPGGHDEYAYLLLADTFAHGRLTNPTHPMWVHFESFQIIWQPTYTAKFYPAQGLILALGQVVLGHPFWGEWLSVGLMCAAICWMLQAWMSPGWALLGGFLAAIRLGTFSYWANDYGGGGCIAAAGGALVLGALLRIKRSPRMRDALLMGLGFAILANSRPYEGLFFGLPVAVALAVWIVGRSRPPVSSVTRRVLAPLLLTLALTGCAMGYYYWRTTGSPWDTPFLVYERTYNPAPQFPWPSLKPIPLQHHAVFRDYYNGPVEARYRLGRTLVGFMALKLNVFLTLDCFYLGPVLTLPLLLALATLPYGFSWKNVTPETRFLLLESGVVVFGSMLPVFFLPHYDAAITSAMLALVLISMRGLRNQTWRGRPAGLFLTRTVPLICLLMLVLRAGAKPLHLPEPRPWPAGGSPSWCALTPTNPERAVTLAELQQRPGRQLAIVRYGSQHDIMLNEWVYNEADLSQAKVVWARDMGPAQNRELIDYFRDRHVWLVEADETPPKVSPYGSPP
jgi:hypothetical protein